MRNIKEKADRPSLRLSKNPGVDKGPQPLMFNPALTTCASERMKTQRFSYFVGFAARERMREAKPVKLKKVAERHFFDTLKRPLWGLSFIYFIPLRIRPWPDIRREGVLRCREW